MTPGSELGEGDPVASGKLLFEFVRGFSARWGELNMFNGLTLLVDELTFN